MNFSFWPFLWFGLPGRLLTILAVKVSSVAILGQAALLLKSAPRSCDVSSGCRFVALALSVIWLRMAASLLVLRNARPATGIQNPETRNSSKKSIHYPPDPDPKFLEKKKKLKIHKNTIFRVFLVFFLDFFFARNLGSGSGG